MIWSKAFIMERERYDGADVAHLILACGRRAGLGPPARALRRRLARAAEPPHPLRLRLSGQSGRDPGRGDGPSPPAAGPGAGRPAEDGRVCDGTLLSRQQYLVDVDRSAATRTAAWRLAGQMTSARDRALDGGDLGEPRTSAADSTPPVMIRRDGRPALVRIAAVGDLHCTKTSQGALPAHLRRRQRGSRRAAPVRRPDRLRASGGGARARRASWPRRSASRRRGPRQPRLRVGTARGGRADPPRGGRRHARRRRRSRSRASASRA